MEAVAAATVTHFKLEDGEAENEKDSEQGIYAAAKMDQTLLLSKKDNNDATNSNNRVIVIEIVDEIDSEEGIYDASQPQKMCLKKRSSSAVAAKKSESLMACPSWSSSTGFCSTQPAAAR